MPRRVSGDVGAPFRARLQALMSERGLSPDDLDRAAGMSYAHTSKLLAGTIRYPELPTLALLCFALELESIDELAPVDEVIAEVLAQRERKAKARRKKATR